MYLINLIELLNQVILACPDTQNDISEINVLENLIIDIGNNVLIKLTKSNTNYKELAFAILSAKNLLKTLYEKLLALKISPNGIWNRFF